jgi:hypothetical protein
MHETTIICPHCKKPFEISDAIRHRIEDELQQAKIERSETLRKEFDLQAQPDFFRRHPFPPIF